MSSSFFGVQLVLDLPSGNALRGRLGDIVREFRGATAMPAQRSCWTRAADALAAAMPTAISGTWDLLREKAQAEYEDWASGLEAMAQWDDAEFGEDGGLLLASLIVLVERDSNADRMLGERCDLPERAWHLRSTYAKLVQLPPLLNFTNVQASGLYLAPRPDHPGFSADVIQGEGFEYLEQVRD